MRGVYDLMYRTDFGVMDVDEQLVPSWYYSKHSTFVNTLLSPIALYFSYGASRILMHRLSVQTIAIMKTSSQSGFAIAAIVGIVAVLALLGGTAYVATHNKAENATSTEATTTAKGGFEMNADENAQLNANVNATTSLGKDVSADAKAGAGVKATTSVGGVNVNVGGNGSFGY
jgi:hypothetical protein